MSSALTCLSEDECHQNGLKHLRLCYRFMAWRVAVCHMRFPATVRFRKRLALGYIHLEIHSTHNGQSCTRAHESNILKQISLFSLTTNSLKMAFGIVLNCSAHYSARHVYVHETTGMVQAGTYLHCHTQARKAGRSIEILVSRR